MAYSSIPKPSVYFNTKLYTGTGNSLNVTSVGFQPDMVWIKDRTGTNNHEINDAVRGANYQIYPNLANAQTNAGGHLTAFASDGFTLGTDGATNTNNSNYVSWNWKAGTGQGSSNTDGSINTTYTSVNTTAGFSISTYTGTGSNATIGHGLGVAPKMIIIKSRSHAKDWTVYHASLGNTKWLELSGSAGEQTNSNRWNNTSPTNQVFSVGVDSGINGSGYTYVAYCFAEKTGYSKFGSYVGNGNADGTFVYTGFKPAFVMTKKTSGTSSWDMHDTKRDTFNVATKHLLAEDAGAEGSTVVLDILSNGFKFRTSNGDRNASGATYIYMAFAEEPLVANSGSNGVPATAR